MKRLFVLAAAVTLTACMGNSVWSQGGQGGGAPGGAGAAGTPAAVGANFNGINPTPFFADPGVRSQLQLNDRQFNRLSAAYQRAYQQYNRGMSELNANATAIQQRNVRAEANGSPSTPIGTNVRTDVAAQQRFARLQQLQNQFYTDFNGSLDTAFTDPALRQRYNQLNWQFQGIGAFNDPRVQQQLNLTAQQRQQLATLQGEWRRQLMNLQRSSRNGLTQDQFNDLQMDFASRLNALLTPEQQQLWTQIVGQRYDIPYSYYFPPTPVQGQAGVRQGTDGQATQKNAQPPRTVR